MTHTTTGPDRWRLMPGLTLATALLLLLASIGMAAFNEKLYRDQKQHEVRVQAEILAASVTAALAFDDASAAREYVAALRANPEIVAAGVYDARGALFARFSRSEGEALSETAELREPFFDGNRLVVTVPILQGGASLGMVRLRTVTEPLAVRLTRYGGTALLVLMAALFMAVLGRAQAALARANTELQARARDLAEANRNLQTEMAEREKAEVALRHSQKMDAIGQLTGGVAHDVNNHLQVIGANLQLLRTSPRLNLEDGQRVDGAVAGVARAATLTAQLLAFARRQALEPRVVNLARVVRDMGELLRRTLGEGVEVETIVSGGLWNVEVDIHQVENAVLNLAVNARDAMRGRGRLTVELGNAALDDSYAATHNEVVPGQYVLLAVSDTGCGMAPDVLERVFEPFFTTKPVGEGTGLGLSMVHGFVKQSGGHVKVYSEVGQGTTVKIYLPRALKAEETAPEAVADIRGGTETVLVVEDDAAVRESVAELLRSLGYRPLMADGPEAALAVVGSGAKIDLLFTDVVMPGGMPTPEFVRRAQALRPGMGVLYTSGYTANAIVHHGRLDEGVTLLSKPYTRPALAAKVRQVLDAPRAGEEPAAPAETQPRTRDRAPPARPAGTGRVLLVEDETLVRLSTADMLAKLGWEVVQASDATAALAALDESPVDVMMTDIGLPGMDGETLAREAGSRHPGLRIVIATGRATSDLPGVTVLAKPYDAAALRRALGEPARAAATVG